MSHILKYFILRYLINEIIIKKAESSETCLVKMRSYDLTTLANVNVIHVGLALIFI
jgi:hypothetical protein